LKGAIRFVRAREAHLLESYPGRQLIHLLSRLEVSQYRIMAISDPAVTTLDFRRWKNLEFCPPTSTAMGSDAIDFDIAWLGLMKIMAQMLHLKSVYTGRGEVKGRIDSPQRATAGNELRERLQIWESTLPESFKPILEPREIATLPYMPVLADLKPIYYRSLDVAVAMGIHQASPQTDGSSSIRHGNVHIGLYASWRFRAPQAHKDALYYSNTADNLGRTINEAMRSLSRQRRR
jgi:hypothetical protein